jgi:hypothetical protein
MFFLSLLFTVKYPMLEDFTHRCVYFSEGQGVGNMRQCIFEKHILGSKWRCLLQQSDDSYSHLVLVSFCKSTKKAKSLRWELI